MRFGSQKIKIISLVLVFGFIYAVNACAHSNGLHGQFYIINGAPSVPVPSDQSDDFGNITIGNFKINKKTSSNDLCNFLTDDIKPTTSETASPGKTKTITFDTIAGATQCDADIKYGDNSSKIITPITITWEKAPGTEATTITHITTTTTTTGSLDDEKLKAWNDELIPHNAVMTVDPLTKENDTLKYIDTRIAGAITLINNAPQITDKADKSNDISFKMPVPSTPNDCTWVNEDGSVLSQATVSPADPTKQVLFKPFANGDKSCQMDIVVGDTKPSTITHVTVNYNATVGSSPAYLTVKIGTDISLFNTWNNKFAVKNGSMMKLNFSTKGDGVVNFQQTDLPFPLLDATSESKEDNSTSLDHLADLFLSAKKTWDTHEYSSGDISSRNITQDMQIAAGMMKLHSQLENDTTEYKYSFLHWKYYFTNLYYNLTKLSPLWLCDKDGDACNLPFYASSKYGAASTADDTLAQIRLAAAFQIASKALEDKGDKSKDSATYKDISQWVKNAIITNNTDTKKDYLKGTQVTTLLPPNVTPSKTYSETIFPLIYLFLQSKDVTEANKPIWTQILTNTITLESDKQSSLADNKILGANHGILGYPDHLINPGDLNPGDFSKDWVFGVKDDYQDDPENAVYVPRSLGAYLLVAKENSDPLSPNHQDIEKSSTILQTEMHEIDTFGTFDPTSGKFQSYTRIKCSTDSSWTCNHTTAELTPLEKSSYLLAQLGLAAHFGQQKDDDDNRDQITFLTKSLSTDIAKFFTPQGYGMPISSEVLTGLYIDGAFTTTLKDAKTGTSLPFNPLIDGHIKSNGDIQYYFTLPDTPTLSTHEAQAPSGAQTSYTGVKKKTQG